MNKESTKDPVSVIGLDLTKIYDNLTDEQKKEMDKSFSQYYIQRTYQGIFPCKQNFNKGDIISISKENSGSDGFILNYNDGDNIGTINDGYFIKYDDRFEIISIRWIGAVPQLTIEINGNMREVESLGFEVVMSARSNKINKLLDVYSEKI